MTTSRLEAFSDGVIAIIITIMVLDLKVPKEDTFSALLPVLPVLLNYMLSFLYLGIYWNNHHHLVRSATHVTGTMMWANLHLLFWLSLIPFTTSWGGQLEPGTASVSVYGFNLLMAAVAYIILQKTILAQHAPDSPIAKAIGKDWKGKFSLLAFALAIVLAFVSPRIASVLYVVVVLAWFVPDRRIERVLHAMHGIGPK